MDGGGFGGGRIGPNALLQLAPVLEAAGGAVLVRAMFAEGGLTGLPEAHGMIPEGPVAAIHQAVRRRADGEALLAEAGTRTAEYILAHRIPKSAQAVLKALPAPLAAPLLAQAIAKNAWTFAGSGHFRLAALRPLVFEIAANPLVRGDASTVPVCAWHAAVFTRLFAVLVHPGTRVREVACCACGDPACRFEIGRA